MADTLLPRFSDPRDIDEFVEKLGQFERGEIGPDAFRAFRLLRGVYGQRQDGFQMVRVKIPFGRLGKAQLDALADVADRYSRGFGHVTTRQNVQFHFVRMDLVETAMRRLDEAGMTTREACGNSVRNVTACEHAGLTGDSPFDVTPYAEAMVRLFLRHPLSSSLPRKFKIAFSGCSNDCAKAHIHDLGFIARVEGGERGFKVVCAGGLSNSPQAAITLHEFVRATEIGRVGEAVLRIFDRLGNRENKARARIKYVLRKLGEQGFRDAYAAARAEVDAEATSELDVVEPPRTTPAPPVVDDGAERPSGYLPWRATSVLDQKQPGYVSVYVRLALGDVTSKQLRALGPLIEKFGDGTLRLTIDQNLLLSWIDVRSLPALYRELQELGLTKPDIHTARDVTSCQGADTCNLAVTSSRGLGAAIMERLDRESMTELPSLANTVIKVSGCPNGCGQHHIADLGFHGGAKTIGGVTVPIYQLHLGGGVDGSGAWFGRQVAKIIAKRVPDAVVLLLRLYERDHAEGESPTAYFRRVEAKKVTELLGPLLKAAPEKADEHDIGQAEGFLVETKAGECAA
jgi:sulfite reductase beta subunit-like hemoprotein